MAVAALRGNKRKSLNKWKNASTQVLAPVENTIYQVRVGSSVRYFY